MNGPRRVDEFIRDNRQLPDHDPDVLDLPTWRALPQIEFAYQKQAKRHRRPPPLPAKLPPPPLPAELPPPTEPEERPPLGCASLITMPQHASVERIPAVTYDQVRWYYQMGVKAGHEVEIEEYPGGWIVAWTRKRKP